MNEEKFEGLREKLMSVMGKDFVCGSISDFVGNPEDFSGWWCTGEGDHEFKDTKMQGCSYYAFDIPDISNRYSNLGSVLNEFSDWLDENELYLEWWDAGTVMIYVS